MDAEKFKFVTASSLNNLLLEKEELGLSLLRRLNLLIL